jgi:hypothetical protein
MAESFRVSIYENQWRARGEAWVDVPPAGCDDELVRPAWSDRSGQVAAHPEGVHCPDGHEWDPHGWNLVVRRSGDALTDSQGWRYAESWRVLEDDFGGSVAPRLSWRVALRTREYVRLARRARTGAVRAVPAAPVEGSPRAAPVAAPAPEGDSVRISTSSVQEGIAQLRVLVRGIEGGSVHLSEQSARSLARTIEELRAIVQRGMVVGSKSMASSRRYPRSAWESGGEPRHLKDESVRWRAGQVAFQQRQELDTLHSRVKEYCREAHIELDVRPPKRAIPETDDGTPAEEGRRPSTWGAQHRLKEVDEVETHALVAKHRSEAVEQIAKETLEVHDLMQRLADSIADEHDVIATVEREVEKARDDTKRGAEALARANEAAEQWSCVCC